MNLYFRFLATILKNLILPKKCDIFDETSVDLRVLPNDLDLNMHMNNGRFLTIMDIGRTDYTMKIGMHRPMMREKWGAVATAINVAFLRPLPPFGKYQLRTKLLSWDDMWFYMEQNFVRNEQIVASAIVKATFLKGGKRISPNIVIPKCGFENARAPEFPHYLKELIEGEEAFIENIKAKNRRS